MPARRHGLRTLAKLEGGLRPNLKPVGESVMEARVDSGPGYRIYFGIDGPLLIILLGGGDKRTQQKDIAVAQSRWTNYKSRKKEGLK